MNKFEMPKIENNFEKFEKIKTPEEFQEFMNSNIKYGFVGKDDEKIYSPNHEGWGVGKQPELKLQTPKEVLESGYGTCWEQTELEKQWFKKNNFECKTLLLMFDKENISQKNPAHTLLAFKEDNKWHWFENTLDNNNGIHDFDTLKDLTEHVKKILINNAVNSGATEEDTKKFKLYEYNTPAYGVSTDEFINNILKNN